MSSVVWYASYGSNLDAERFRCYIEGGQPDGGRIAQPGCTNATPPADDRPIVLPYRLYFAGHSITWSGSPAYLEHAVDEDESTLARAYLITVEQFAEVLAQECGGVSLSAALPLDQIVATGGGTLVAGAYGHVLCPGDIDGIPIVTCTSPNPRRHPGQPSDTYLATMAKGIAASHCLSDIAIDDYIARVAPSQPLTPDPLVLSLDFALDDTAFDPTWWPIDERDDCDVDPFDEPIVDGNQMGDFWRVSRFLEATT